MAPWRQIAASVRRSRFRLGTMKWPEQLTAGFPYEYLGPGADARQRIAELKEELPLSHWTRMQPPSGAELEIAR